MIITVSAHLGVIYLFGVPKQVVFPDLAFLFKVREGMVSASFCFALKRDESGMIGPASRLCYYPFGNVYDNGKICWGKYGISENDFDQRCGEADPGIF